MNDELDRHSGSPVDLVAERGPDASAGRTAFNHGAVDLAAGLKRAAVQILAFLAHPEVQARVDAFVEASQNWRRKVEAIQSSGYVPYFEGLGRSPLAARLETHGVRYLSWRQFQQHQSERKVLIAFHALARRRCWHPALLQHVARLMDHRSDLRLLDEAFRLAGCPEGRAAFVSLIERAHDGDAPAGDALIAVAARVAPHAPSSRGRPMRFETVLHRTFLAWNQDEGGPSGYTYADSRGDFTDAVTTATRLELDRPGFNPIASRRSLNKIRRASPRWTR